MNYLFLKPSGTLSEFIKCYWIMELDLKTSVFEKARILPYGCINLNFYYGNKYKISNLKNSEDYLPSSEISGLKKTYSDVSPTGKIGIFSITFYPWGSSVFFNKQVKEFENQNISLIDIIGKEGKELEDKMISAKNNLIRKAIIESYLMEKLKNYHFSNHNRILKVISIINKHRGIISIDKLGNHINLGKRQLERLFHEKIGINIKSFMRIVRFQNVLFTQQNKTFNKLTTLAHECGYYDQAHFINDFKLFTGFTPKSYFKENTPFSDYFSSYPLV